MAEWFRNTDWNDEIAHAFDARLKRARGKAQYLNIQAHMLLATHPVVAVDLCRRALALDDPSQTARAGLYLGTALAVQGDYDGAISALEAAIEAERREPMHRTAAYLDQALLVAWGKRHDLYDAALGRLEYERSLPLIEQPLTALIALALIGSERGENSAGAAMLALDTVGGPGAKDSDFPSYLPLRDLVDRLRGVAGFQ